MSILNELFPDIYVINLARRTDRWNEVQAEFKKHGIKNVQRIEAVDGRTVNLKKNIGSDGTNMTGGDIGCTLSHLNTVKLARHLKLDKYLVMEDDVEFREDFNDLFAYFWTQVPDDWDCVYAGGTHFRHTPPLKVTKNVYKIRWTYTTHFAVMRNTMFDALIDVWGRADDKVDLGIHTLQKKFNFYCFMPHLAWQRSGFSDITNHDCDYKFIKEYVPES